MTFEYETYLSASFSARCWIESYDSITKSKLNLYINDI